MLGRGDGSFVAARSFASGYYAIAEADFNNDGRADLATDAGVLLGNGDGTFQTDLSASLGRPIVVGDFNHDGNIDVIGGDGFYNGYFYLSLGKGDGTFQNPVSYQVPDCGTVYSLAVGDFNRDGSLDVAIGCSGKGLYVFLNNGQGGFGTAVEYDSGGSNLFVITGDFNRDGKLDLIVGDSVANTVSFLAGNGDGTFQAPLVIGSTNLPIYIRAADLNGDGKLDLAVVNGVTGRGTVSVMLGNGDGTFQVPVAYRVGNSPIAVTIADFNRDNKLDLAVANFSDGTVSLFTETATAASCPL
jgi:hypothetical protein